MEIAFDDITKAKVCVLCVYVRSVERDDEVFRAAKINEEPQLTKISLQNYKSDNKSIRSTLQ